MFSTLLISSYIVPSSCPEDDNVKNIDHCTTSKMIGVLQFLLLFDTYCIFTLVKKISSKHFIVLHVFSLGSRKLEKSA